MKRVLLSGGFEGLVNFGDIIQLRSISNYYIKHGYKPLIHLNKATFQNLLHFEILKDSFGEDLVIYDDSGYFLNADLKPITQKSVDIFHLYGGGVFNLSWGWGKYKLMIVEKLLNFFKPKRYFITGQQISKDFLPYFKKHIEVFQPEILAVRDSESLKYCVEENLKSDFSFDDAVEYLLYVKERIREGYERRVSRDDSFLSKKVLFLHINFSYYTLEKEEDIWAFRERIKPLLKEADEVILVKSFQNYSIEVKDTFRAVDYIFLTHEKPFGKFLDLASFSLKENWEELGRSFPELFSEKAICISNSYHTALFFSFLGIPSLLTKLSSYYTHKGSELWRTDVTFPLSYEKILELKRWQDEVLNELIKKRHKFLEYFEALLHRDPAYTRFPSEEKFTYQDIPDYRGFRLECDEYVSGYIKWFQEEREKLIGWCKHLENENAKSWERIGNLERELTFYKEQLEKIYNSRGWKVLNFYYKVKYWSLSKLGLIKE